MTIGNAVEGAWHLVRGGWRRKFNLAGHSVEDSKPSDFMKVRGGRRLWLSRTSGRAHDLAANARPIETAKLSHSLEKQRRLPSSRRPDKHRPAQETRPGKVVHGVGDGARGSEVVTRAPAAVKRSQRSDGRARLHVVVWSARTREAEQSDSLRLRTPPEPTLSSSLEKTSWCDALSTCSGGFWNSSVDAPGFKQLQKAARSLANVRRQQIQSQYVKG